jgi:hypothetical protein
MSLDWRQAWGSQADEMRRLKAELDQAANDSF